MDRREQLVLHRDYIEKENLDVLMNFDDSIQYERSIFDAVDGIFDIPIPPETADLVRLHKEIRTRKSFTVMEFGLGYSTIVMADALRKNKIEWDALEAKPDVRNRHMFKLFSIDTSQEWIDKVKQRMPKSLSEIVTIQKSGVNIGKHNGQLCHYYSTIPNIVPDFIYLDGPHPKDVKGEINGLSFDCDERTVMSADLLLLEPTFLPGTFIIVDGRTNNARFLQNNFRRNYKVNWDNAQDITTFELDEPRLGKYNILGKDYF